MTLVDSQFIGEEESKDGERLAILSPIKKADFWSQDKLLSVITKLNGDAELQRVTKVFRCERREIFGRSQVNISTLRNCCQILLDEIEACMKKQLAKDWGSYERALSFYNECLTDADFERLP